MLFFAESTCPSGYHTCTFNVDLINFKKKESFNELTLWVKKTFWTLRNYDGQSGDNSQKSFINNSKQKTLVYQQEIIV